MRRSRNTKTIPLFLLSLLPPLACSFQLNMILGSPSKKNLPSLPRDVKESVSRCRTSVQKALESRLSRITVEMPVGAKFGIEKNTSEKKKKGKQTDDPSGMPTMESLDKSDRELARIFVEMFQPVGSDAISVVFNRETLAEKARKLWKGDGNAECGVLSLGKKGGDKKKKKKSVGFAAKMEAEVGAEAGPFALPDGCEVALFVAPGPKELIAVEKACNDVGMGTLVVILNGRLEKIDKFGSEGAKELFTQDFEPVFHLAAAPQEESPGCLLYRAFPEEWLLARKPKVGQPKVIASQQDKLSLEECKMAYENIEVGDMEEAFEGVLENVANWFK